VSKTGHLVINATELGRQRGGNESYIAGLLAGLVELQPSAQISLLTCRWDKPAPLLPFRQMNLGVYRRLPFLLWQQTLALRQLKADWYLANFFLPPILPCRGAVVVHDLSFRAHPEYFPWTVTWYMRWLTGQAMRQAQCILTVSEFSRRELHHFYQIDPAKVVVVPNGVRMEFCPAADEAGVEADHVILARYGVTESYLLALGNIHPRKNLARVLEAYVSLQRRQKSLPAMVWVGLPRWDSSELLVKAREAGVILTGFVAQEDLPAFYRQAMMLVYPSLYEGFGLPPLEAMACGTPVVASNTTSLPEVVGDAALTVDPTDTAALAEAMACLLADPKLRQHLRQAGVERAREFTWRRVAQHTVDALLLRNSVN
jgi:glycosyltransferase involved in cell wall biosynthesis